MAEVGAGKGRKQAAELWALRQSVRPMVTVWLRWSV